MAPFYVGEFITLLPFRTLVLYESCEKILAWEKREPRLIYSLDTWLVDGINHFNLFHVSSVASREASVNGV